MNVLVLAWSYIKVNKLNTLLNVLLLTLGVGIICFFLLVFHQLKERFENNVKGVNLVIGAKGSPLQLILSSVYHIDNPTGNINFEEVKKITANPRWVKKAIPLSLGDSYQGFRIVGSDRSYPEHYDCKLAHGKWWETSMEVTLGNEVADRLGLKVGDTFHGAHGIGHKDDALHVHEEKSYRVAGIMKESRTILDRLILTGIESVWEVHGAHDDNDTAEESNDKEITAMLVQYQSPYAALTLPRRINAESQFQAAVPALEITRLFALLGIGLEAGKAFSLLILAVAGISIFIALYNAMKNRKYDLAIMRTIGGKRFTLASQIILEACFISIMGAVLGLVMGHTAVAVINYYFSEQLQFSLNALSFLGDELWLSIFVVILGLISSLIPALQVYYVDISKTLSHGKNI